MCLWLSKLISVRLLRTLILHIYARQARIVKRIIAISLIALLLFNVLGYYGLLVGLQYKNSNELVQRFNSDSFEPAETVTLTVPIAVPYAYDYQDYVRVDGEFEYQGESYRMVKQKFEKDVLYIVCYKDNTNKNIKQALSDYAKTFSDKPSDSKQQNTKLFQNFIKDFLSACTSIEHQNTGWTKDLLFAQLQNHQGRIQLTITGPPPRA